MASWAVKGGKISAAAAADRGRSRPTYLIGKIYRKVAGAGGWLGLEPANPRQITAQALGCLAEFRVGDSDQVGYLALRVARLHQRVNHGSK
jgi:hypothetical protein